MPPDVRPIERKLAALASIFLFKRLKHMKKTMLLAFCGLALSAIGQSDPVVAVNLINVPIRIEQDLKADGYFQGALKSFDQKDLGAAARYVREGAHALLQEAPVFGDASKRKLVEQRVGELFALSFKIESGLVRDDDALKAAFADADESLAHRYYEASRTLIDESPENFALRLRGLGTHLRNSKKYHVAAEKAQIAAVSDEAFALADAIDRLKSSERALTPPLRARLDKLMADVQALRLDE